MLIATPADIKRIKPSDKTKAFSVQNEKGLTLRVTPKGAYSWCLRYSYSGKQVSYTIGQYPDIDLKRATGEARQIRARVQLKEAVPHIAKLETKAAPEATAITFNSIVPQWRENFAQHHYSTKTYTEYCRLLDKLILPAFGNREMSGEVRRDLRQWLNDMQRKSVVNARQCWRVLSSVVKWAREDERIGEDETILPHWKPQPEGSRERHMSLTEARRAWKALDAPSKLVSRLHADALAVLMLLGQRRGEVAGMRRDEIDKHFRTWTIPADRHKTGRRKKLRGKPHVVPIPPEAGDILERRWSISEAQGSEYIFSTKNNRPVGETYLTRDWRTVADSIGLNDVHLHDMRHTVATHMAAMGVQMEVISRVLNHQNDTSITNTVYNSHDYSKEKRAALVAWERRLLD